MARILDTIPTFEVFAKKAGMEPPFIRGMLRKELYESAHPEVFEAFDGDHQSVEGSHAVMIELNKIRPRVREGAPVVARLIEEVEPAVAELLRIPGGVQPPQHILMVGNLNPNAAIGQVGDELVVFHCLEWFQDEQTHRVLVAHEDTHAWHERLLGKGPSGDLVWTAFCEGLAIQVSRAVAPRRPENDYFWYGVPGFDEWLPWCREHQGELVSRLNEGIDDPSAAEVLFGAGFVHGRWRVGYFLADLLVGAIDRPPSELVRLSVDEARTEVLSALKTLQAGTPPASDAVTPGP